MRGQINKDAVLYVAMVMAMGHEGKAKPKLHVLGDIYYACFGHTYFKCSLMFAYM